MLYQGLEGRQRREQIPCASAATAAARQRQRAASNGSPRLVGRRAAAFGTVATRIDAGVRGGCACSAGTERSADMEEPHEPDEARGRDRRQEAGRSPARNISKACATAARSISTASASRTSPRIRRSAMPRARSRGSTTRCTTRSSKDVLTCPTDTGSGGFTHKFFRVARSREDLIGQRDAIAALGAHVLRLDGPHAGLQGVADEHARRQSRLLRKVRRQRQGAGTAARRTTCCS